MKLPPPATVEEYFSRLEPAQVAGLEKLREVIRKAAPKSAEEVISYAMPAFRYKGVLVWYAAATHHIGFYPSSKPIEVFAEQLKPYKTSKGAIQLPWDKPLPVKLIKEIVLFRVQANEELEMMKAVKKKAAKKK